MKKLLGLLFSLTTVAGACSTVREDLPTGNESYDPLADASLIPDAPLPTPTPTPSVAPLPNPGGGVGGLPGECGEPAPPAITRVKVTILNGQAAQYILDATPLVGPNGAYCRLIGYTDDRLYCAVRPEGHPERWACEALQVGAASDTGRTGPTWTVDGRPCLGISGEGSCGNHPENQFLVLAHGAGTFRACIAGGVCGEHTLP